MYVPGERGRSEDDPHFRSWRELIIKLLVKVVPGTSRDSVDGWLDDALKVRVRAPAERGRANSAAEKIVAAAIELAPESVHVVKGHTSPRKVVEISGISASEVFARLARWLSDQPSSR